VPGNSIDWRWTVSGILTRMAADLAAFFFAVIAEVFKFFISLI
jgi:hypothetical protein